MIVDTGAYVLSMISVLIGCLVRDFFIPLFVWRKHLKGKSLTYRFWFCILTQAFIQINLVLTLGILNILNRYTFIGFNIAIYSLILWNFSDKKFFEKCRNGFYALWNSYKEEWFTRYIISLVGKRGKIIFRNLKSQKLRDKVKKHWLEGLLLSGIIAYNLWFLTYNVFNYHCYQFSDIPVHQSWIYELEQGNLFSDGIYPFGMHIMIYFVRMVFGLNLREILLYAGAYQFVILIISVNLLAKEIFVGKYIPAAAILIVSLMVNQGRYGASLPQEAGMYAVVAIAYFMVRYLHKEREKLLIPGDSRLKRLLRINLYINKKYINSELLLLMISVYLVISYHYYTAIAAVFVICSLGIAYFPRILKKHNFVPIFFSGLMGALIAVVPIGICLLKGIPFEASIDWAKTVMAGDVWLGSTPEYKSTLAKALGNENTFDDGAKDNLDAENDELDITVSTNSKISPVRMINYYKNSLYDFGSTVMFGPTATKLLFACMMSGVGCALIMLLWGKYRYFGCDYLALNIVMLIFFTVGASQALGIPEVIAAARASTFAQPFIGMIYLMPVDFIFRILSIWENRYFQTLLKGISLAVCVMAAFVIIKAGWYHNYFDVNQAYYNEAEYVLRNIKKSFKKFSYTIVSPTEEYYDVIDHGRHTELSQFVNMISKNEDKFMFTTDYVFFFIEKLVLQDYNYGRVEVSPEFALKDFVFMEDVQDYYYQRAVIESKAYYWAKKFKEMYPKNFKVYFENDIFVVYLLEQNTYYPYDLQIDYLEDLRKMTYTDNLNLHDSKGM